MKRGGKAMKDESVKQVVNVMVNSDMKKPRMKKAKKAKKKLVAGDMVMLQSGRIPAPKSGVMGAGRLQSPGLLFGGAMPSPLQSSSYATAPQVAKPFSRVEFIGSSDEFYNRNRNKSDDIMISVNPSDIIPDVTPSQRLIPSHNPNTPYDYKANEYHDFMTNQVMVGRTPVLARADTTPSERAVASQPSAGYLMTHSPLRATVNNLRKALDASEPEIAPEKGDDIPNAGRAMSSKEALASPNAHEYYKARAMASPQVQNTLKKNFPGHSRIITDSPEVVPNPTLRPADQRTPGFAYQKARGGSVF
jgi:hypothetical protein